MDVSFRRIFAALSISILCPCSLAADEPDACTTEAVCPRSRACTASSAVKVSTDDFAGKVDDTVSWRSEVYQKKPDGDYASFCYFRAMRLKNPSRDLLPLHWDAGKLSYKGEVGDGCLSVCEEGSRVAPDKQGLTGPFWTRLQRPQSVPSKSWGPEGGYSDVQAGTWKAIEAIEATKPTAVPAPREIRRQLFIGTNTEGPVVVEFISVNEGRFARHVVRNIGTASVVISMVLLRDERAAEAEDPVVFDQLVLEPGQAFELKGGWSNSDQAVIERSARIMVKAGNSEVSFDGIELGATEGIK